MKLGKKAKMSLNAGTLIQFLVLLAIGFQAFAAVIPQVQNGSQEVANQSIPLAGLFGTNGVVILLVVAAFIVLIVKATGGGR